MEEDKEENEKLLSATQNELEGARNKQMADSEIFETRIQDIQKKTILIQGQLAASEERTSQMQADHAKEVGRLKAEQSEAIDKLTQEMHHLTEDKNILSDQKYSLEETIQKQ